MQEKEMKYCFSLVTTNTCINMTWPDLSNKTMPGGLNPSSKWVAVEVKILNNKSRSLAGKTSAATLCQGKKMMKEKEQKNQKQQQSKNLFILWCSVYNRI